MSGVNRVVWSEGMFLKPHHFQQQDRFFENIIDHRLNNCLSNGWGFTRLVVDEDLLKQGKICISEASGVLPDGTCFNFPAKDQSPPILELEPDLRDKKLYLSITLSRFGSRETSGIEEELKATRYKTMEQSIIDNTAESPEEETISVGNIQLSILTEGDSLDGYSCLGFAKIVEISSEKAVTLDKYYIPPMLDCSQSSLLAGFLNELTGMLHQRGEELAGRLVDSRSSGTAELSDLVFLQVVNKLEPLCIHLSQKTGLHPQELFSQLLLIAGELSTFSVKTKRPPLFQMYRQDDLQSTFSSLFSCIRSCLSGVSQQSAVPLKLEEKKYGIRVAKINDRSLVGQAVFIIAVKSDIDPGVFQSQFQHQVKVAPVEKILDLVRANLPGIDMRVLPVAPRQIPYNTGFTYFELDKSSDYWSLLNDSGGFAFHIGAEFPGLKLEFWAIRG